MAKRNTCMMYACESSPNILYQMHIYIYTQYKHINVYTHMIHVDTYPNHLAESGTGFRPTKAN